MSRPIELLSPARNLECGIEAVRHGADAVYIGAPRFGARAAAGNSVEDIAQLVRFAHPFGVRIYVTLNTLLHDDELPVVETLINELADAGVDALITQDERIVSSSIPLHASTQMDNRTVEDVRARLHAGYEQTVLARELSLSDIAAIHAAVPEMPLEVFVHGALCVSYSGRCYASEYCFGRSANRGECAQFCRLPFDLLDADGRVVDDLRQRHLLSLRDMNRSEDLEALMDAGASSFKIEGRLKDVAYVKNITAYYRQRIDAILARRSADYRRASYGTSIFSFTPNPLKSFNRGFTDYFLHGRKPDMACHATPKSLGEPMGTAKEVTPRSLTVAGDATFSNGDGLCFLTADGRLQGFRVNRVDEQGHLYPADAAVLAVLRRGTQLYRNQDAAFERILSRPTAERRLPVRWLVEDVVAGDDASVTQTGFRLTLTTADERFSSVSRFFPHPLEAARTPQTDAFCRQLSRLGDTPFCTTSADIVLHLSADWFVPASTMAEWRRAVTEDLKNCLSPLHLSCSEQGTQLLAGETKSNPATPSSQKHHLPLPASKGQWGKDAVLMTCRYCLRHAIGLCLKTPGGKQHPLKEPLSLLLADGRRFPLRFDCKNCQMLVLAPQS